MTTHQTPSSSSEVPHEEVIPAEKLSYFRGRLSNRLHSLIVAEFSRLSHEGHLTKAELARRTGREPSQITRWLSEPGNWTIDTVSDLCLAMGCEPTIMLSSLGEPGDKPADKPADKSTERPDSGRPASASSRSHPRDPE